MKLIDLGNNKFTKVDDEDYERLKKYKWYYQNTYVYRINKKKEMVLMHREIMGLSKGDGLEVDHINTDDEDNKLNNQKENLRICTRTENGKNRKRNKNNTSGYKGVYWDKSVTKWTTIICNNGKLIYLGLFENIIDAAKVYDEWAIKLYGEYAKTNFPISNKS